MNQSKKDKVSVIFVLPCQAISKETIMGSEAIVTYVMRMYYGNTKRQARFKQYADLVEFKAYGFELTRTLEFVEPMGAILANRLKSQNYEVKEALQIATFVKDFGFITAQNYEVNHLMQKISVLERLPDFDNLYKTIRMEITSWGDPVVDVLGKLVYDNEFGVVKRDPFAKAGRLALRKKLSLHRLNPLRTITTALSDLSVKSDSNHDGGVGM
jgi:hypothetical protein